MKPSICFVFPCQLQTGWCWLVYYLGIDFSARDHGPSPRSVSFRCEQRCYLLMHAKIEQVVSMVGSRYLELILLPTNTCLHRCTPRFSNGNQQHLVLSHWAQTKRGCRRQRRERSSYQFLVDNHDCSEPVKFLRR